MLKAIFSKLPTNQAMRSFVIFMAVVLPYVALYSLGLISQLPEQWMFVLWLFASILMGFVTDENGFRNPFRHQEEKHKS